MKEQRNILNKNSAKPNQRAPLRKSTYYDVAHQRIMTSHNNDVSLPVYDLVVAGPEKQMHHGLLVVRRVDERDALVLIVEGNHLNRHL